MFLFMLQFVTLIFLIFSLTFYLASLQTFFSYPITFAKILFSLQPRAQGASPWLWREKRPADKVVVSFQTVQTIFFNISHPPSFRKIMVRPL